MLLKLLGGILACLCLSCVAPGPRTFRFESSEFTLPEGWVEGESPKREVFVAVRDNGDPVELFAVVAKRNPSPGLVMDPRDWTRLHEGMSDTLIDSLRSKDVVRNARRVESRIERTSPYPRLWSRYEFDGELAGQPMKASFSHCMIVSDRGIYSVSLRERRSSYATDPGRFGRLMETLRTRP